VPAYLTPGAHGLPAGPAGAAALSGDLSAILTYCLSGPPERLCTLGATWSLSNVLQPGNVVLDPGAFNQITRVDPAWLTDAYRSWATPGGTPIMAQGGVNIGVLNATLGRSGLALQTSGASDGHRLAGCIATGTHGSDLQVGAVHDTVLALYVVVGPSQAVLLQPSQRSFTPDLAQWFQDNTSLPTRDVADDELFNAAKVALGSLGFVHSVIVEAVPLYELHGLSVQRGLYDDAVWTAMETLDPSPLCEGVTTKVPIPATSPDFFTVVLAPYADAGDVGAFPTMLWKRPAAAPFQPPDPSRPALSTDLTRLLSALIPKVDGALTEGLVSSIVTSETIAMYPAHEVAPVFPGTYFGPTTLPPGNGRSSEIVVDHARTRDAVTTVISALQAEAQAGRHLLGGIGVRFVPATTALLGMNIHPMNTYIEFPGLGSSDMPRVQQAVWQALRAAGIPFSCHWGQQYGMDAAGVRAYFGDRVDRWKAARSRLLTTPEARTVFSTPLLANVGLDARVPATWP
jgi:hypothetical protein